MGAAVVARLADDGWSVVATDSCTDDSAIPYSMATVADLDAVAAAGGEHVIAQQVDVRDQDDLDRAVATAVDSMASPWPGPATVPSPPSGTSLGERSARSGSAVRSTAADSSPANGGG